jgi:hypothetical protein
MSSIDWEGGLAGAGTGAAIGSFGGPIGTGIGAAGGFVLGSGLLGGGMSGQNKRGVRGQMLNVNQADQARQLQMRGQQQMFSEELRRRAMGQGPSVAERQMGAGMGQQIQASRSAAASGRGGNVGLTQRLASQQAAQGTANVIRDAGMLRAQEMQTAGQTYAGDLDRQRAADLQARGFSIDEARAQLEADRERERLEAERAEGNVQRRQQFLGGLMSAAGGALSDRRAKEDIKPMYSDFFSKEPDEAATFGRQLRSALAPAPAAAPVAAAPARSQEEVVRRAVEQARQNEQTRAPAQKKDEGSSGIGSALSSLGGSLLSDFTAKELPPLKAGVPTARFPDVSAEENRAAFEPVEPVRYRYKPEAAERMALEQGATPDEQAMVFDDKRAPRNGIIAQDLERSPAFDDSVVETPAGKAVDRDRALSEMLAQGAGFDKRLKELEAYLQSAESKRLKKAAEVKR